MRRTRPPTPGRRAWLALSLQTRRAVARILTSNAKRYKISTRDRTRLSEHRAFSSALGRPKRLSYLSAAKTWSTHLIKKTSFRAFPTRQARATSTATNFPKALHARAATTSTCSKSLFKTAAATLQTMCATASACERVTPTRSRPPCSASAPSTIRTSPTKTTLEATRPLSVSL